MEAQYFEKETKMENPLLKGLIIIGMIFLVISIFYIFFAIQNVSKETRYIGADSQGNTINVSGSGIVYAVPDVAIATFSAITEEPTLEYALSKNKEKINRVIDFLKRQGVNAEDIKTLDFNIYPKYEWQKTGIDLTVYPLGKRVITSYEAVESLEVIIKDNDQIGRIIQGSIDAGASQTSNLKFIISDEESLKKEARELAIANAKTKATDIANSLGLRIGNASDFSEEYTIPTYIVSDTSTTGSGNNLEIIVKENKIEVKVNISYDIK